MNTITKLAALDERILRLYYLEGAHHTGFIRGVNAGMHESRWFRGLEKEPPRYEKSTEYYLMRHLKKQYKRMLKSIK